MSQWKEIVKNIEEDVRRRLTITPKWSHQINMKISACPDRVSIEQRSEHRYVKPEALGSIPGWGSQITFHNRQRFGLIRTSSIFPLRCRRTTWNYSLNEIVNRHLGLSLTLWRQTRHLEYDLWLLISIFLRLLISCKSQKNRLRVSSNRFK